MEINIIVLDYIENDNGYILSDKILNIEYNNINEVPKSYTLLIINNLKKLPDSILSENYYFSMSYYTEFPILLYGLIYINYNIRCFAKLINFNQSLYVYSHHLFTGDDIADEESEIMDCYGNIINDNVDKMRKRRSPLLIYLGNYYADDMINKLSDYFDIVKKDYELINFGTLKYCLLTEKKIYIKAAIKYNRFEKNNY